MTAGLDPAASAAQRRARARARIADAARLLPFLGAAFLLLPDFVLSGGPAAAGATAGWLNYLFAVWAMLIGAAFWIARAHARHGAGPGDAGP